MKAGWRQDSVESTGVTFVRKLTRALSYLDTHHAKFSSRNIKLPDHFSQFQGYNDFWRKKEKEPRLSVPELEGHIKCLSESLMHPWFASKVFDPLHSDVEGLVDALSMYKAYLVSKCSQVQKHHQSVVEPCADEDKASLITISGLVGPASPAYCELEQKLECLPLYKPLYVNDIAPYDRYNG